MKTLSASRLETVKRALRRWDPIGVIKTLEEDGLPPNEYDSYAPHLLRIVESGASGGDVAIRLVSIRVDSMSLGDRRPTEREEEIGEKLSQWRERGFQDEPDFKFTQYDF
jgi:hypothetical protein